jgi:dynein heavy chain
VHHHEELDFSHTAAGAAGPTPLLDRPLQHKYQPEGRVFAGVQGPREELEVAREAKKSLERQERLTAIEASRTKREEAEYTYAARKVQYAQLQARHEQLLGEATPALAAAQTAAASLSEAPLTELRNAPAPSPAVMATVISVHILLTNSPTAPSYQQAAQRLQYPDLFINDLRNFNCDHVSEASLEQVSALMRQLDVDEVLIQSPVSATLLLWVANICRYNEVYRMVRPVRIEMQGAALALEDMDEARRVAAKKLSYTLAWREN